MPRRYTTKLSLAKLNETVNSLKSKRAGNAIDSTDPEENDKEETDEEDREEEDDEDGSLENSRRQGPLRQVLENTPHSTHPAFNMGLCQSVNPERKMSLFPSCALTVPVPLFVSGQLTPIVEPCYRRPSGHEDWMRIVHIYRSKYLQQTRTQKQREKKQANHIYNGHLFDMAEQIAMQDNAFFRDSYDYYYTGGNLNLMTFASQMVAMHVSGVEPQQCLHLSQVGVEAELWSPLHSEKLTGMTSEIFELLPMDSFRVNHGNTFLARLLNEIAIYELRQRKTQSASVNESDEDSDNETPSDKYELCCQSKYTSQDGPFISVAQAINRANTLAIACQDHTVRFKDIVAEQDISKHEVCILKGIHKSSTWAQLLASQEHCFHYVCQSALLSIDMRCANEAISPCFASSAHSTNCESFSCLTRSHNPNLLYVASNHKLHCLDMRCLGKKLTDRSVVTWTHQMSYPPTFMDAIMHEGSEYVALGSALPSDQRVCELKGALARSYTEMSSPSLPYAPPQLEEALLNASLQSYFVDIYADLGERIKSCTTGIKFHRLEQSTDGAFAQLLTANSVGDIFCQRVTQRDELEMQREQRTGAHTNAAVLYYADLVRHQVQRRLNCTKVESMVTLREVLKSPAERVVEEEKPLIFEDVNIDYGFSDTVSEADSEEVLQEQREKEPSTSKAAVAAAAPKQPEPVVQLQKKKAVNRGPWQKSAYNLSRFTDLISTRLLSIWDIDDFELTRDVHIDMIDAKLKEKHKGASVSNEDRTAAWLQQTVQPQEAEPTCDPTIYVPGTNLPTHFDATNSDFRELLPETFQIADTNVKLEASFDDKPSFMRQPHSTLRPGEYTIIERQSDPPAKRLKTKYSMGF